MYWIPGRTAIWPRHVGLRPGFIHLGDCGRSGWQVARANPLSFVDPDGRCITYVEQETADGIEGFCLGQGGAVHEFDAGVRYFGGGGWFEDTSLR